MPTIRHWTIGLFLALFLALTGCLPQLTEDQRKTLSSLRRVDDYPLYVMNYYGDYHFDDFMKKGEKTYKEWLRFFRTHFPIGMLPERPIRRTFACSCFSAGNAKGEPIAGHNLDANKLTSMLLFTHPPGRYASVAMVNLCDLGFRKANLAKLPWEYKLWLLVSPYVTKEGMNECGLMAAANSAPVSQATNDPEKVPMLPEEALRMLLDNAKDVDEAIVLLKRINLVFMWSRSVHLFLADPSGDKAVVEFIDGKMKVVRSKLPWIAANKFFLWGVTPEQGSRMDARYDRIYRTMTERGAKLSEDESMRLLQKVSVNDTTWSTVYNLVSGDLQVAMGGKYDQVYRFKLPLKKDIPKGQ